MERKLMDRKLILWIEDDADRLDALVYPLINSGYKIITAVNAKEAMDAVGKFGNGLCIIILDILIPHGNTNAFSKISPYTGLSVLKAIRSMGINVPVLVFTVVQDPEITEELKKLGTNKILLKGRLLPSDMEKEVEKICSRRKTK